MVLSCAKMTAINTVHHHDMASESRLVMSLLLKTALMPLNSWLHFRQQTLSGVEYINGGSIYRSKSIESKSNPGKQWL